MARVTAVAAGGLFLVAGPSVAGDEETRQLPAAAQAPTEAVRPSPWQIGFGGMASTAAGEFSTHIDNAGGLLIHMERRVRGVFSLGGETSLLWYGEEHREVSLGSLIAEAPDATADIDTYNSMWLLHARLRAQHRTGRWRPYADGLVGFNRLTTKTYVRGGTTCTQWGCDTTNLATETHAADVVFSYGAGAGLAIGFRPSEPVRLDLSIRYLRGGEALYLTKGAIHREGGVVSLDLSRSRTDLIVLYVGVALGQ